MPALKEGVLAAARATGLSALARQASARSLRILCYHGVWTLGRRNHRDGNFMAPDRFAARMARLARSGHPVLPLGEAIERLAGGTLPPAAVVITIDDGWVSTLTHMLPVLRAHRLPATLYATTWYAGRGLPIVNVTVRFLCATAGRTDIDRDAAIERIEALPANDRLEALRRFGRDLGVAEGWLEARQFEVLSPAELAEASGRGLDIQLHSHRHRSFAERIEELAGEIGDNRRALTEALGPVPLDHFCFPGGYTHARAKGILLAAGIRSATLTAPGLNPPGSDPFALRRFLDSDETSEAEFDAYLSGAADYLRALRAIAPFGRA